MKQVGCWQLPNGMMLYYMAGGSTFNVSGVGFTNAGSINDPPGKVGLAHATEHMLARASRKYTLDEVDLMCWKYMGGPDDDVDIRTAHTNVYFGHGELYQRYKMNAVFDMMASFVHPKTRLITPVDFLSEKGAVHQETYLRGTDVIQEVLDDYLRKTLYARNPARNRIDCDVDHLRTMTTRDVRRFVDRYYVPKNGFIILFGPKPEAAKAMAMQYFGDWEEARTPIFDYDHSDDVPRVSGVLSKEIELPGSHQYHVGVAFPTETFSTENGEALDFLACILEMRLMTKLRDENSNMEAGVYRTPVYIERTKVHGMISASFATIDKDFAKRAEEVMVQEFRGLTADLVRPEEFDAIGFRLLDEYRNALRNDGAALSEMVIDAISNGDTYLQQFVATPERIKGVTRRKLRTVANKYFSSKNGYARVLIKPA